MDHLEVYGEGPLRRNELGLIDLWVLLLEPRRGRCEPFYLDAFTYI